MISKSTLRTSVKDRYKPGHLYELIDHYGTPRGFCLFIEMIEPGKLTLEEVVRPNHWHMKILRNGKIEHHDTSIITLIETPMID